MKERGSQALFCQAKLFSRRHIFFFPFKSPGSYFCVKMGKPYGLKELISKEKITVRYCLFKQCVVEDKAFLSKGAVHLGKIRTGLDIP